MKGKDCSGRDVPLLNYSPNRVADADFSTRGGSRNTDNQQAEAQHHASPSAQSCDAPTPALDRSDSMSTNTDSPKTPGWMLGPAQDSRSDPAALSIQHPIVQSHVPSQRHSQGSLSDGRSPTSYHPPPIYTSNSPYSLSLNGIPPSPYGQLSPATGPLQSSPSPPSTPATPVASGFKPVVKKYPCQFAKEYDCPETFTTSGHASRHGKKHTGEKNVKCPKCDKTFARKDNMKQHLKTHEGKGGGKSDVTMTT
ncbi:MAG: hypothetical protein M1837_005586 [Sclerophora amabilis]|nr:MAG: hypothetical protein M1837_005586 [Sclerophora amabilis]